MNPLATFRRHALGMAVLPAVYFLIPPTASANETGFGSSDVSVSGPQFGESSTPTPSPGPWGDVTGDGRINQDDVQMFRAYTDNPLNIPSASQRERIRRYGDVDGVVNRTDIGNDVVNLQDVQRLALLSGGLIDAGTAGPHMPGYGDIDGDGQVTIADSLRVARAIKNLESDPSITHRVFSRGGGDVSPTVPYISFGNGYINSLDLSVIEKRAAGTDTNLPAYLDYWPAQLPTAHYPGVTSDQYTLRDLNGLSGDTVGQTKYFTQAVEEIRGYTVTRISGSDNSTVGIFKGIDGSIYAMYVLYPYSFANRRIDFMSPIKVLDARAAREGSGSWSGKTFGDAKDYGVRPVPYTGTVLSREDVFTQAAGAFPTGTPASTWSQTVRVRLDVALLAGPTSTTEMQQAFFFDFMPHIGPVGRGQAALRGASEPTNDRPRLELDTVRVRGRSYGQLTP